MTETDVFERRLRAALVRHTDGAPTDFDALAFARTVAAREPRRHGLGAVLGWRGVAVPQVAWVVLLLAVLLTAMVAGMLIAGSQPQRALPALVPPVGQLFACPAGANPDLPGPRDQERPATVGPMAFDRRAGRMVALSIAGAGVETWAFDVCTNTWTQMHPALEPTGVVDWRPLIYDVDSDVTILFSSDEVWTYDLQANTWTGKGAAPTDAMPWAYDPQTGLVIVTDYGSGDLWSYDVGADARTPIHQVNRPDENLAYAAYDASVDRIVGYGGGYPSAAWLFDIRTGTWSRSGAKAPVISAGYGMQAPTIAYDEAARRTVVFGGWLGLYDATADRWEALDAAAIGRPAGGGSWPVSMVYDPVNQRLVGWLPGSEASTNVVALDLVTRAWTQLLEAQ